MTIPTETLTKWADLKESKDVQKLVKITRLSKATIYNILKDGECTSDVAAKITAFYNKRKKVREYAEKLMEDQD